MVKWIGGATAALVLAVGGATIAGDILSKRANAPETIAVASIPPEATLANVIPVDETAIAEDFDNGDAMASAPASSAANSSGAASSAAPKLAPDGSSEASAGADFAPSTARSATSRTAQAPAAKPPKAAAPARPAVARTGAGAASTPRATVQRTAQRAPKKKNSRFVVKRILDIKGPMKYGEWHWDEKGVPAGPLVITVDLKARVISVFRDGYEIGAAVAMLGTKKHPTPTGTFPILRKQRHNVSEKYNNAPMPWSMFLTRSGIAIHGGSVVENGYASHGCIAIPDEMASRLFKIAKNGDKVIITNGQTMSMGDSII